MKLSKSKTINELDRSEKDNISLNDDAGYDLSLIIPVDIFQDSMSSVGSLGFNDSMGSSFHSLESINEASFSKRTSSFQNWDKVFDDTDDETEDESIQFMKPTIASSDASTAATSRTSTSSRPRNSNSSKRQGKCRSSKQRTSGSSSKSSRSGSSRSSNAKKPDQDKEKGRHRSDADHPRTCRRSRSPKPTSEVAGDLSRPKIVAPAVSAPHESIAADDTASHASRRRTRGTRRGASRSPKRKISPKPGFQRSLTTTTASGSPKPQYPGLQRSLTAQPTVDEDRSERRETYRKNMIERGRQRRQAANHGRSDSPRPATTERNKPPSALKVVW